MTAPAVTLASVLVAAAAPAAPDTQDAPVVAIACEQDPHLCRRAPLVFDETDALPVEWSFDTGWVPSGSPLQVRLESLLAAYTRIRLEGDLFTDWQVEDHPGALVFDAPGRTRRGLLSYHYGVLVNAQGKVQIDLGPNTSINWQGLIPYVPKVDVQVQEDRVFDAWGWAPGVTSISQSEPQQVAEFDMTQLFGVSFPGLESGFELDVAVDLEVTWTNHRIVVERLEEGAVQPVEGGPIASAGAITHDPAGDAVLAELEVHPEGTVDYEGTLHLMPSLYVETLDQTWTMPLGSIPVPITSTAVDWTFSPEQVHVPLPDVELLDELADFGTVTLGEDAYYGYVVRSDGLSSGVVSVASSDPAAFPVVETDYELAPQQDRVASVRFVPQHEGLHEAALLLHTNDPDEPTQMMMLRGRGRAGEAEPTPEPTDAPPTMREGGCGCRLPGREPSPRGLWLAAIAVGLASARRKRR